MKPCRFRPFPALMVLAFILTGCAAASQQEPSADGPLDPKNPVTISIWNYYNGAQLSFLNDLVKKFNETDGKVQGIFVESFSQGSVNDLESNVLAAAQGKVGAGKIPNIFAAYADTAYAVDRLGLAADLSGYLTEEERAAFVDSYINEGRFSEEGGIKIFPVAKSTEIFMLNKTDWDLFSSATGASREDLATMEGLVRVAKAYYKWTDGLTPAPNDGRAFFGRDAMANYFLIGAMPLGCEIFTVRDGRLDLNFDHDVLRTLWDSYYVPYIKGYFASSGRFRSDDIKTGNIIALAGSSSGATFFPNKVSGIFVILNTGELPDSPEQPCLSKPGIYLRDLDPASAPSNRSADLLLERAPIEVVRSFGISTDAKWRPLFLFGEEGAGDSYMPLFQPLQAAFASRSPGDPSGYGHWALFPPRFREMSGAPSSIPFR